MLYCLKKLATAEEAKDVHLDQIPDEMLQARCPALTDVATVVVPHLQLVGRFVAESLVENPDQHLQLAATSAGKHTRTLILNSP